VRIFLLSDIHANLEALNACLDAVPKYDCAVNLGDVVGYGADPNAVVDLVRGQDPLLVRGNHDKAVSGVMDLEHFNPMAGLAALWTREHLNPENLEWLRALPQGPIRMEGLEDTQFVHGSPLDEDEYVVSARDSQEPLLTASARITFFGHTHRQGGFSLEGAETEVIQPEWASTDETSAWEMPLREGVKYLINPGSAGQPRDDDWRAAFGVFDTERRVMEFYRVPYDVKAAQDKILEAQLPPRLAQRLATGR
jgi:diadenosine tetraphosphatase ApaH/serine/threonine PP2A family protein phosphatase